MALIICSECGKKFSDKANACPNCACPVERKKVNVRIFSKNSMVQKCSVTIDNNPIGQLGGMLLGKQKDIIITLPAGTHYIGLSTQVVHTGQLDGVAGIGQSQDGKQFEITDKDEYIEIEIIPKGSFTGNTGTYTVKDIKHYNKKELEELNKIKQEEQKIKETKKEKQKENIQNIKNNKNIFFIIGIILVLIIILSLAFLQSTKNNKYYGTYTSKNYIPYEGTDDRNATLILNSNSCTFYINDSYGVKTNYNCSYTLNEELEKIEINIKNEYNNDKITCGRFTESSTSTFWSCKGLYGSVSFYK